MDDHQDTVENVIRMSFDGFKMFVSPSFRVVPF